jgi:bifunctional oligoribonuclease and PAP phosphatase NrnA
VEEAEVVMLMKERPDGEIRVSMRSRPAVDVAAIATALDGGGHRQAAGCTLPGPFPRARGLFLEAYDRLYPR